MPHVEYFVHLLPIGARLFLNEIEEGRNREKSILYHLQVISQKVQDFGLCPSGAVDHPMNVLFQLSDYL